MRMMTRQRQRAANVVRCIRKRFVINILRAEKRMTDQLEKYLKSVKEPVFISYKSSELIISDCITLNQMMKIEFDVMKMDLQRGKMDFLTFNRKLNNLFEGIEHLLNNKPAL
jgi:hypothetical protein